MTLSGVEDGIVRQLPPVFLMINSFETGGSERQFAYIGRSLDPSSFQVHLGCIRQGGLLPEGVTEVPRFPLGGSLYGPQSLRTRWRLARHLRQRKVSIAHAFDFYTNLTLIPAARLARVPVVIGSHRQIGDLLTRAQFRAQLAALRLCDAVVCNSRAAAERLIESGLPENRINLIGNGLPPESFAEVAPALPHREGRLRVGMVARMNDRSKNHSGFLRVAAALCRKFSNVEFVLAGDGPLRPELEREAESLGVRDRVNFLGARTDISAVLACLDVSVLSSSSESLSNVILESMAAGLPVVANLVGGNHELVTSDRGILVPAQDYEAMASAIERLLKDPQLRTQMGRDGKKFVHANFSLTSVSNRYQALYTGLLTKKNWRASPVSSRSTTAGSKGRMRIAIVAPTLRYVGGQAVQADLLLRQWHDDRDVDAQFLPVDPTFPAGLVWAERIPVLRTVIRQPLYVAALWRRLKNAEISHIFSASYSSFLLAPLPAWIVARLHGKKTLINYRSGEARDHLQRSRIARAVLAKTDRLVVPSGYLVDVFREFGLHAEVVPNIVDLSQFCYRLRQALRPHLVCTRGFHPYYCIDVAVQAFAEVQQQFPEARLDLVGQGPLEGEIRNLVRKLNLKHVNFTGVASRQEIGRFYDQADIFINASRLDNMPVSIIEAFACGTPVVTTAPESIRYLVEHERTGLLSEPGDAHALAKNVIRLLQDPELATRLSLQAHEESRRYRWHAVREQWLDVYRSMACEKEEVARKGLSVAGN
jgi:glycosyltransferase involved in cell wall biosynthesis